MRGSGPGRGARPNGPKHPDRPFSRIRERMGNERIVACLPQTHFEDAPAADRHKDGLFLRPDL